MRLKEVARAVLLWCCCQCVVSFSLWRCTGLNQRLGVTARNKINFQAIPTGGSVKIGDKVVTAEVLRGLQLTNYENQKRNVGDLMGREKSKFMKWPCLHDTIFVN